MIFGRVFIVAEIQAVDCYFKRTSRGSSWSYSRRYSISSICWSCLYSYSPHPSLRPISSVSLHIVDMFPSHCWHVLIAGTAAWYWEEPSYVSLCLAQQARYFDSMDSV
jgi:hypothetical protein